MRQFNLFQIKKSKLLIFTLFVFLILSNTIVGQVTVTNPNNTTPALSATYTSLALAIADVNIRTAISGPVTITIDAGNPQTAPAGGYVIQNTGITGGSNTNRITFDGGGNTITAGVGTSTTTDAIFKIIGTDFITLQNFVMVESGGNTTATQQIEWGVAVLYASTTNGSQNVTIQNNSITLNRTNVNTFGIYSNSTHAAGTPGTSATASTAAGGNSNLKIYSNTISNVNMGIVVVGPTAIADVNTGIEIGGSTLGNTITNYGTNGTFSTYANVSGTVNGILVRNCNGFVISNNSITSSAGGTTSGTLNGIQVPAASNPPTATFTNNINNNTIALQSGVSATINGITYPSGSASATSVLNVNNNNFTQLNYSVTSSGATTAITVASTNLTTSISNNTFTNLTTNTTGSFTFISHNYTMPANGSTSINNNSIVTAFNKTGAGGVVTLTTTSSSSPNSASLTQTNNNFSNITVTGATTISGFNNTDGSGSSPSKTITGNTFNNWTGGTSAITAMSYTYWGGGTSNNLSSNTITNITGQNSITGISIGSAFGSTNPVSISSNTIGNLTSTGTGGSVVGITSSNAGTGSIININSNTVSTLASTGASSVSGISVTGATTTNVTKNTICDISGSNASSTVNGILVSAGSTVTLSNNRVSDLRTPVANAANPLVGINITGGTTVNAHYNTVNLNGSSSGALFGSSALSASTTPTLTLNNNILQNASSTTGAGVAVAYRRSTSTLTSYASTSNRNDFVASTIYTDGTTPQVTLAAYKTLVGPTRDANSMSVAPSFLSTTCGNSNFLKLDPSIASQLESGGANIAGITDDFEGNVRQGNAGYPTQNNGGGTAPDIGADEYDGVPSVQCSGTPPASTINGAASVCLNTGTTLSLSTTYTDLGIGYQWGSSMTAGGPYTNLGTLTTQATGNLTAPMYYVCTITCSNGGGQFVTPEKTVSLFAQPTVTVSPSTGTICLPGGSAITLTASGANTYTWSPATGLSATIGATVTANPSITTTYVVTGTDNNSCTNTASTVITVTNTPVAPTTTNFGICVGGSIPSGQGLTSTSVGGNVITGSQTINFDVSSQPVETNSAPGNTVSSATMAALPAGSTVTSIVINYSGLVALSSSWRSDIRLGLSGAIVNSAAADPLAPGSAGTLNYSRTASTGITANNAGGTVNLLYWDNVDDNVGSAEATFPTGTAVASLTINYSYPSPTAIAWYDSPTGGNFIANGSPFNPIGVDPALPNSNVAGSYTYYAQVNNGACSSTRSSAVLTIGSSPTATATATQSTICIGSSTTLTANPVGSSPFTYLWNDPSASSTQAVSVSPTSNTTYTVTVTDGCATTTTASITITVDAPTVGSPTATPVCGSGTSTLSTTGSVGTIRWYDAPTNGNLIGTGTTVVSPTINSATTYYVNATNFGTQSTGLGSLGTPTPNNSSLTAERGIVVNITNSGILNSAQFYAASGAYAGTARLVNNSTGTQIASTVISGTAATAGMQTMNLNWELVAGTSYRLLLSLTSGSYSNNNTSVNYSTSPWNNFGTNGSITSGYESGSTSTTTYSNFYNMSYTPACVTSRTAVPVPYSVPPTVGTATATPATVCAGISSSLNLSGVDPFYTTFTWSNGGSGLPLSVSPLNTTTYTVTATDGTCSSSTSVTVTVNPNPSAVIITQGSSVSKCSSAPAIQLDATGGNISNTAQVGTGTTTNSTTGYPSPFSNYYGGTKHQMLIRASELTALGIPANASISSLTFNVYAVGSTFSGTLNNFQIDMTNTSSTVLTSSSFIGSLTNVRAAASLVVPTTGLPTNLTIPITPFVWNGTDNLLIQTSYSNANSGTSTDYVQMRNSDPGFVSTNWYRSDSESAATVLAAATPTSSGNARPNIGIAYTINGTLNWSPTSGLYADAGATTMYTSGPTAYAAPSMTSVYTATATIGSCSSSASITVNIDGTLVTSTADAGAGTLRAALACVTDGGTIMYDQPTTVSTVLTAPLTIDKNVTIMGSSPSSRPEITTSASGISVDAGKTLTLKDVDIKSTAPTQTFGGAGSVSISGTTVAKE